LRALDIHKNDGSAAIRLQSKGEYAQEDYFDGERFLDVSAKVSTHRQFAKSLFEDSLQA
jgi:hypothetical protein